MFNQKAIKVRKAIILLIILLTVIILSTTGCLSKLFPNLPPGINPPEEEGGGVIYLEPSVLNITTGQVFTLELKATSISNLKGYSVTINYNPALLKLNEVTEGPFLSAANKNTTFFYTKIDNSSGSVRIDCALLGADLGVSGEGVLAALSFVGLNTASTNLELKNIKARNANNQLITLSN